MDALSNIHQQSVQTNDVGRSGSLLGGFGLIAHVTGLPLRLLEIGTSAGLNLRWDHYRYEWPSGGWGEVTSLVRLEKVFVDMAPSIPPHIDVCERAGCDPSPVDIASESGRLTLLSYIWPDHTDRVQRLEAAINVARSVPCSIDKAHGEEWLEERLDKPAVGTATVICHSVVWPYISDHGRERIVRTIEAAGIRASQKVPVAWLRMEPNNDNDFEIRLRIYPGFEERVIAMSRPHTPSVRWMFKHE